MASKVICRYPLEDEVGFAPEDAEKEAFDGEEGSRAPVDEDAEVPKEEKVLDTKAKDSNSRLAQVEETFELHTGNRRFGLMSLLPRPQEPNGKLYKMGSSHRVLVWGFP